MKKLLTAVCFALLSAAAACAAQPGQANILGVTPEMCSPAYWIRAAEHADKVLLTPEQAENFSAQVKQTPKTGCVDVLSLPGLLSKTELLAKLECYSLPKKDRYIGAQKVAPVYWSALDAQRNLAAVSELNEVKFGAVVREAAVKDFPTDDPLYADPDDIEFDMNMESVLKVWEPVAVLNRSADGEWLFVESGTCSGWVKKADVAVADRAELQKIYARSFLVVTGNRIRQDIDHNEPNAERPELSMGTRLPLAADKPASVAGVMTLYNWVVTLPVRAEDGSLVEKMVRIPFSADVSAGFLPYTQANFIRQAFKMLGERYGWGGMWHARDCSAFAKDIYATFGIELPRNSGQQARVPSYHVDLTKLTPAQKEKLIMKQPAGAILRMSGHIMLYLGRSGGRAFMINDLYSAYPEALDGKKATINSVALSMFDVRRKSGKAFLEDLLDLNVVK